MPERNSDSDLTLSAGWRARGTRLVITDAEVPRPVALELAPDRMATAPSRTVVDTVVGGQRVNRALNASIAFVSLALLAPLLIIIAAVVKLTSPGPILYLQPRVGLDRRARRAAMPLDRRGRDLGGAIFTIYKFRSMRSDAEGESGAVWACKGDGRVTAVGRFLRKTRLDELPQLINVLRGDMNIVGPRPERPSIFARLREDITDYELRQRAKPGITGLAQINQAYDACLDDVRRKVDYDLAYIERQSIGEDLRIMAKTLPVMLFHRGGW